MNIIFLDIDGVLNIMGESYRSLSKGHSHVMESHLVRRLEFIVERVKFVKIVLSSSWGLEHALRVLKEHEFKYTHLLTERTPRGLPKRGQQISAYLDTVKDLDRIVILEDEPSDIYDYIDEDYIVAVDMSIGLSDRDAIQAVIVLNATDEEYSAIVDFTEENIKRYVELGYRPGVTGIYPEITTKVPWDSLALNINTLTMRPIITK